MPILPDTDFNAEYYGCSNSTNPKRHASENASNTNHQGTVSWLGSLRNLSLSHTTTQRNLNAASTIKEVAQVNGAQIELKSDFIKRRFTQNSSTLTSTEIGRNFKEKNIRLLGIIIQCFVYTESEVNQYKTFIQSKLEEIIVALDNAHQQAITQGKWLYHSAYKQVWAHI